MYLINIYLQITYNRFFIYQKAYFQKWTFARKSNYLLLNKHEENNGMARSTELVATIWFK